MEPPTISYSTLSPSAVIEIVSIHYGLAVVSCEFLHRGLNDTFRVETSDGRYAFRVYRAGWRSLSEVQFELDALRHCERRGVSVAVPLARRDGSFVSKIDQPEGSRPAALFMYAQGAQPGEHTDEQAGLFGRASARLHEACRDFSSVHSRFALDLTHLVDQPLKAALPFLQHRSDDQKYPTELAGRISKKIEAIQQHLDCGFCHGDLHGANVAFDGDKVTMFDFDCGGMGWRSYDIAVYRWILQVRNLAQRWVPFLDAYQEQRKLGQVDLDAMPWFVAARHIWVLGLHTGNAGFLGRSFMSDKLYWDFWLKLIRDWDAQELSSL